MYERGGSIRRESKREEESESGSVGRREGSESEGERETNRGGRTEGGRESEREKTRGERMHYGRLLNKGFFIMAFPCIQNTTPCSIISFST